MSNASVRPKMHHYVPRWYLACFADREGFLHVYDRQTQAYRRQRPQQVMKINSYYRQTWAPDGVDPNVMETMLGVWLEPEGKVALERLALSPAELTSDDTANLLSYLELQRIRVPRQAEHAKALIRANLLRLAPAEAVSAILSGKVQLTIKESARFDYMRVLIGALSPWLGHMEWEVVAAEDGAAFITTDSPVSFLNPSVPPPGEAGIGLAGTMVFFPLSSQRTLLLRHPERPAEESRSSVKLLPTPEHEDGQIPITHGAVWERDVVDRFNWKMLQLSSRFVVANAESVLRRCVDDSAA